MQDIDFLPNEYRQRHAQRQSQPWQIFVAAAMLGLLVIAAGAQQYRRHALRNDLKTLDPAYETAMKQKTRLEQLQKQYQTAKASAELYTYLRHPWPRTQLLSALVGPLPEAVTMEQLQIMRESGAAAPVDSRSPADKKAEEDRLKAAPPAQRDLTKLSAKVDPIETVIVMTGTTTDVAALHRYIAALDAMEIFDKAELDSVNSMETGKGQGAIQFRAILTVQPGYGQPGGPGSGTVVQNNPRKP